MFKNLANFSLCRTKLEALGFYLAYLFLGILLGALGGSISYIATGTSEASAHMGQIIAIVYVAILALTVFQKKRLLNHFGYWVLLVVAVFMSVFGGAMLGLIPIAFLMTRKNNQLA